MNQFGSLLLVLGILGIIAVGIRLGGLDEEDEIKQLSSLSLDELLKLRAFAASCFILVFAGMFFTYWRAPQ